MRKIFAVLSALLLLAVLLVLPAAPVSASDQPRYGYTLLSNDVQRTAYQEIRNGIKSLNPEITLSIHATETNMQSMTDDAQYAIKMVEKDCPELFWFTGIYSITANGTTDDVKITVEPQYVLNGQSVIAGSSQVTNANNQLNQAVTAALATLPRNASDYEKALVLHDYIIDRVTYVHEGDHQTAYGALVGGKAVCAGYARAYQLLLLKAGIPCSYVTGKSNDPQTGNLVNHAWNLVWLDGKCYYTDVTWDDQSTNGVFHEYLNVSKEEISLTHFLNDGEVLPASCGHDNYRFFVKNSGKGICDIRDHKEDTDVADCFQTKSVNGRNAEYYCTIHYHKDDFDSWLDSHYKNIGKKLGFESFQVSTISVGHEYHVMFSGTLADSTPEPSVTPTESRPVQQPSEPTQVQATEQTSQPTQNQIPTHTAQADETQPSVAPTEPIPTTLPTEPTAPIDPTIAPQESQASSETSESQQQTQSSGNINGADSNAVDLEQPKENNSFVIGIIFGVVVIGGGAGVFILIQKRKQ